MPSYLALFMAAFTPGPSNMSAVRDVSSYYSPIAVILNVGSAETLGSTNHGQGFRKATFVKSSAVSFNHCCQSCEYILRLNVERQLIFKKKGLHDIDLVKLNISFIVLSIDLNKGSVILPIISEGFIAKKFETH